MTLHRGKKAIAHHEAGHAVIARVLGMAVPHVQLTHGEAVAPTESAAYLARNADPATRIAALENDAKVGLAGGLAQFKYQPLSPGATKKARKEGWRYDWQNAGSAASEAVALRHGIEPVAGQHLDDAYRDEAIALLNRLQDETVILVEQHWPAIRRVAEALLARRYLTGDNLDAMIASS